ncbi:MAG: UDP-N-acetylmuramoyl-L-alanine--D-glutamate ligase [Candidatus Cloacimonadales bacterium]|nr:UDP-N-acetylmuramoyl-L-alanine--D-glutamate ligase [Candidatus Cloacimonadales bacterium]
MERITTKFGILGMARSGLAAAAKITELGGNVFISEFKPEDKIENAAEIKKKFTCEFGGHSDEILANDVIILSPGIPQTIPILQKAKTKNIEVISEIEFGYRIKHPGSKIIAVTGSNGKSTTVSLIHHILQTAGFKAIPAGNIGTAFTAFPIEKPGIDFIVLELSSFQLELIATFKPDVAAVLNITPDHLNRYKNMDEYAKAKFNIFRNMNLADLAILNSDDEFTQKFSSSIKAGIKYFSLSGKSDIEFSKKKNLTYRGKTISIENATIKGPHNIANIMASILAVSPFEITEEKIEKAISTFRPLPHRLEFVEEIDGISFYNDSKATNTDSVKYALRSFPKPVRIIMGGAGKGEDYSILNPILKKHAKKIYLVGDTRFEMAEAFKDTVEIEIFESYEAVINAAFNDSFHGDVIVLSPACTSYDMFKNFEERGERFKQIVRNLKR